MINATNEIQFVYFIVFAIIYPSISFMKRDRTRDIKIVLLITPIAGWIILFLIPLLFTYWWEPKTIEGRVALVLGTAPETKNGENNRYFDGRITAASELYKSWKIDCILVSGDNANTNYNEPKYMEESLMKEWIPSQRIYLDYAGFRTLDSLKRANEIFGLDSFYIVTQPFHAVRAQMLAQNLDLRTKIILAPWQSMYDIRVYIREIGARVMMYIDIFFDRNTHVGWETIPINLQDIDKNGKTCLQRESTQ